MSEHDNSEGLNDGSPEDDSILSDTGIQEDMDLSREDQQPPTQEMPSQDDEVDTTSIPSFSAAPMAGATGNDTSSTWQGGGGGTPFMSNSAPVYRAPEQESREKIRPTGPSTPTIVLGVIVSLFAVIFLALGLVYLYYGESMTRSIRWSAVFPILFAVLGIFFLLMAVLYGLAARRTGNRLRESIDGSDKPPTWTGRYAQDQSEGMAEDGTSVKTVDTDTAFSSPGREG